MSVWDEVMQLVGEGKTPVIRVTYAMLAPAVPKRPGRKPRPARTLAEMQAAPVLGDSSRPRCLNPACRKRLTKGRIVCDDTCRLLALVPYRALMELLGDESYEPTRTEGDYADALAVRNEYAAALAGRLAKRGAGGGRAGKR